MWTKKATAINYNLVNAQKVLNGLYPDEVHGLGGDCLNPKCDYVFTPQDEQEMQQNRGWFTCPKCHHTYNLFDLEAMQGTNKVNLSPTAMGQIGEQVVESMGQIPLLGTITWTSNEYTYPIDLIAGEYGVEVKTNHSEAQPRFKMGGGAYGKGTGRSQPMVEKANWCFTQGLTPALVGVRLNFYTDKADIFVRPGSFTDTWIGSGQLQHVATEDFSNLNPYKNPHDVPPPSEMPEDDTDADIPF
jgi:hypothetical protein